MTTVLERFDMKWIHDPSGCFIWQASRDRYGYGAFKFRGQMRGAHRVAYELHVGRVPSDLTIDHLCRIRACVNVAHMELVSDRENVRRGESFSAKERRQTHCVHGHELSGENLNVGPDGRRNCRSCWRDRSRAYNARRHAERT